ncbi:MAG: CvpA family protein, partial [candidate division Zixibacteria bacterium]|nr:CvpA family protein [candidate division Zixibacteria bacterium]
MNWIDAVLLVLLLAMVVVGTKKGLIRELTAFVIFFVAIIVSINYIDHFAVWVHSQLGGSPLVSAFLSFIILLAGTYAAFKIVGFIFYKIANIKEVGKKDQMGGALVGFLRGWILIGFVTFLTFLLPMPNSFYGAFNNSLFGSAVAKTVPL